MNFMELDPASPVTRFNQRGLQAGVNMIGDLATDNFGGFFNDTLGAGGDIMNYYDNYPTIDNLRRENQALKEELKRVKGRLTFKEESVEHLTDMFRNE